MSVKIRQAISNCLTQIRNGTFNEDTIRTLLIVSREYIKNEGLIRELAHFIAHPVRDRGIFHAKVNNRYAKWKLIDDQYQKTNDGRADFNNIKSESELSDFLLGAVNIDKIDSKLFEILYFDGIKDISEEHLLKYTKLTRAKAISYLKSVYRKEKNNYVLILGELEESIEGRKRMVDKLGLNILDEEGRQGVINLLKEDQKHKLKLEKIRMEIDHLQKVIRGTIDFKSVFSRNEIDSEIEASFTKLIEDFDLDHHFITSISENRNDILICVMTLLHDSAFTFYDGNEARTFLCFYMDSPQSSKAIDYGEFYSVENILNNGVFALYITYKVYGKINSYPLFVSDLKIGDYFNEEFMEQLGSSSLLKEIPWTTVERIENKLRLVKT